MKRTLLLALATVLVATSCQRQETVSDGPIIALVLKTLNNPFFIDMQSGAEKAAKELNVTLLVQAAEREVDVEKQMQIVENLIQRRVSAICVAPSGSKEIVPAVVKANAANIPVLVIDTRVDQTALSEANGTVATFIGSDNYEGGKIAGTQMVQALKGTGKVAILEGIPGHETGDQRLKGFHEIVDNESGIEVVVSQTANWERDQGFNVFQNILQSNPDVNALFSCNDMMALGAIEAIAAAGRTDEIVVIGFDAVNDARQAIRDGRMLGSVAQYPSEMGRLAVENAYRLIQGESIPDYLPVKIALVNKANVDAGATP